MNEREQLQIRRLAYEVGAQHQSSPVRQPRQMDRVTRPLRRRQAEDYVVWLGIVLGAFLVGLLLGGVG